MKAEELKKMKSDHAELLKMHAEVGCEFVCNKDRIFPSDIYKWIDDGIQIATHLQSETNSLIAAYDRYAEYESIIDQLKTIDPIVSAGVINVEKLSENVHNLDEKMIRMHKSWRIILAALAAALNLDIHKSNDTPDKDDAKEPVAATVQKTTNTSEQNWIPLKMNKLPEDRYAYNKTTGEIVDRRTGLKVTKRPYKDGMKYLFDIEGKIVYIRSSDIEEMFNEPKQEPKPETVETKEPTIPPRKILIECKPLDWLGPLIDTSRYFIFSDGRIQDTKAGKPVFPLNSCQVVLEAIDGSKGTWNIHELVWAAFHPEDRSKIRVSGGVFKINGHAEDNRLTNLVFKPTTTTVVNSLTNLPTQTTNMTGGKQEEKPKLDESVKVESRLIDWIAGIDPSKYSISRDGKIVNNHAGGKEIVSNMHAGKRVVKLQGKKGKNATYTVADLVNKAYPDQPHAIRSSGKFRIEDVTKPFDINTVVDKPAKETVTSERMIPVDWIDGIPSTKYLVSEQGYVLNTISGKRINPNSSGSINMSDAIDRGSCKFRIQLKMKTLIWKAFHAEDRKLEKVHIDHIDGDVSNCAIENLRKKNCR